MLSFPALTNREPRLADALFGWIALGQLTEARPLLRTQRRAKRSLQRDLPIQPAIAGEVCRESPGCRGIGRSWASCRLRAIPPGGIGTQHRSVVRRRRLRGRPSPLHDAAKRVRPTEIERVVDSLPTRPHGVDCASRSVNQHARSICANCVALGAPPT